MSSSPWSSKETKIVSRRLNVFWLRKDGHTEHSERKKRRNRQKKKWEDNLNELVEMGFASSARAAENRARWKGLLQSHL